MTTTQITPVPGNDLRAHFAKQYLDLTGNALDDSLPLHKVLDQFYTLVHGIKPAEEFHQVTEEQHAAHRGEVSNKSTIDHPCKMVWVIADEMIGSKRKDVLAACVKAGVAFYTARTQYQQWLTIRKEMAEREAKMAKN
jgi:hypothetical protein